MSDNNIFYPPANEVIPNLYIGPWEARSDVEKLNVKCVVSVLTNKERGYSIYPAELPENVIEHSYDINDVPNATLEPVLDQCLSIIHQTLTAGSGVLVHCAAGISRSASVIIAYLIQYEGMTMTDAIRHLKSVRPSVYPNRSFMEQLAEFEKKLKQ